VTEIKMVDGKKRVVIEATPDDVCDLCGDVAELRPYGPNGENVCFPCGMKDEAAAIRAFSALMDGEESDVH